MNRLVLLAIASLLCLTPVVSLHAADSAAAERASIQGVLDAQVAAWNNGDIDGFMAGYWKSPDLIFTSGGKIRRGWDVTMQKYKDRYGTSKETMGKLSFGDIEIRVIAPGAAWVLGRWDLAGPDGKSGGIFTLVMQKIEGHWVIAHDHTSLGS